MRKFVYTVLVAGILLVFGVVVLVITTNQPLVRSRSVHFKSGEIREIIITDGSNGKQVTLTDPDEIEEYRSKLNQTKFQKGKRVDFTGWSYRIKVDTEEEESSFTVLSDSEIIMDGMVYEVQEDFYDMAKKAFEQ